MSKKEEDEEGGKGRRKRWRRGNTFPTRILELTLKEA